MKLISQYLKNYYEYSFSFDHKPLKIEEYKILGITKIKTLETIHNVSLKDSLEFRIKLKKIQNFTAKTFFLLLGLVIFSLWFISLLVSIKEFSFGVIFVHIFGYPLITWLSLATLFFLFMLFYVITLEILKKILPLKKIRMLKLLDEVDENFKSFKTKAYWLERDIEFISNQDANTIWIKQSYLKSNAHDLVNWILSICTKSELYTYKKQSNKFYKLLLARIAFIVDDYKISKFEQYTGLFSAPIKNDHDLEKIAQKYIKEKQVGRDYWDCYKNALDKQAFYMESFEVAINQK